MMKMQPMMKIIKLTLRIRSVVLRIHYIISYYIQFIHYIYYINIIHIILDIIISTIIIVGLFFTYMMMIFVLSPFACKSINTTISMRTQYLRYNKPTTQPLVVTTALRNDDSITFVALCHSVHKQGSKWPQKVGMVLGIKFDPFCLYLSCSLDLSSRNVNSEGGSNFNAGKMDQT